MADIVLSGTWMPIGTEKTVTNNRVFRGKFYGNGHTISGLQLADRQHNGLFGTTNGAVIRDLTLVVDDDAAIAASYDGIQYLGGIAGYATNTEFANVTVEAPANKVLGMEKTNNYAVYAGGFAGVATGTSVIGDSRVRGNSL
jgi:hypothetical protein